MANFWEDPAFIGGAIGTVVAPGVGTALGAAIGNSFRNQGPARTPERVQVDMGAAQNPTYEADRQRSLQQAQLAAGRQGPQAGFANIDQSQQAQFRQGQVGLAQALAAQANGQGPSIAQAQLKQATDRNLAQALAMAQSTQGGQASGLVARQALTAQQGTAQQAAADSSMLRLNEQMQARNMLGQVLAGARGQDIGLASEQAGLQQQSMLANQQSALQQTALNDQLQRFYDQQATGLSQGQAQMGLQGAQLQAQVGLTNEQMQQAAYDAERERQWRQQTYAIDKIGQTAGAAGSMLSVAGV